MEEKWPEEWFVEDIIKTDNVSGHIQEFSTKSFRNTKRLNADRTKFQFYFVHK